MVHQKNKPIEHCSFPQLVLTLDVRRVIEPAFLCQLFQTKSFACIILYDSFVDQGDGAFLQNSAKMYADDIQHNGAALIIAEDSRVAGRIKADGMHLEGGLDAFDVLENQKKNQKIVGFGNLRTRHCAMSVAEAGVDYVFFGKLGADKKPSSHPRNIALAKWWAEIMEVPAIIQAGSDLATIDETLETTCEFIAIEEMIFAHDHPFIVLDRVKEKCKNHPLS
ncbi:MULTISPECIES: thiamine phosphate synthase [Bartonella]|uniref:Thiamine-phosphate pyrophosphorylase n=1 Tax=Bartonella chomelii TaxID=236402 RepID=A0ABR6E504_9HYPH|nr:MULTISPECIES: thiamine phosphate synthase [Bartonella]MBA9082740.1 thiamine-phosphate pyrophosphorylase [Bartonella chomelii]